MYLDIYIYIISNKYASIICHKIINIINLRVVIVFVHCACIDISKNTSKNIMLSRPFFPSLVLKNRLTSFVVSLPSSRNNVASGVSTAMNQYFNLLGNNKNSSSSRSSNSTNVSFNNSINSSIRLFHSSASLSGPKKKGGKESKEVNDEEAAPIELPKVSDFENTMDKRIGYLESEFNGLRAGRASTDMFNHIDVAAYGSKMSIAEAGQISLKSPTKLSIGKGGKYNLRYIFV